jgi:hypothetical protein
VELENNDNMDTHIKQITKQDNTYNCKRCGLLFTEKKHLVQHLKKLIPCMPVENDFNMSELLIELTKKTGIPCQYCNKLYSNKYNMAKHKCIPFNDLKKNLEIIQTILNNNKQVKDDIKLESNTNLDKIDKSCVCKRCGSYLKEKRYLLQHLKRKVMCMAIESDVDTKILLDEFIKPKYAHCKLCNKSYSNKYNMAKHKCDRLTKIQNDLLQINKTLKEIKTLN